MTIRQTDQDMIPLKKRDHALLGETSVRYNSVYGNHCSRHLQKNEEKAPGTHCIVSSTGVQIAVLFDNRPDTVIHLLTPYLQMRLKTGKLTKEDIDRMTGDIQNISGRKALADAIVDDLNELPGTWTGAE